MEKVNIDERYPENEEAGRSPAPYESFFRVINSTFDFKKINSFIDVGCADGHLIDFINLNFPLIKIAGIEYFEYHKKHASSSIVDKIFIHDIRDSLPTNFEGEKFDIVVCTEVGEHIEPEYTGIFLTNLKKLTGQYLIMTWSKHGGAENPQSDPHHQHLNPLQFNDFVNLMSQNGFKINIPLSQSLVQSSLKYPHFFFWWRESLTVWEVIN